MNQFPNFTPTPDIEAGKTGIIPGTVGIPEDVFYTTAQRQEVPAQKSQNNSLLIVGLVIAAFFLFGGRK